MSEATNKNMMSCPTCGAEIAKSAKVCPSCGAKMKKPWYKKWWVWVLIVVIAGGVGGSQSKSKSLGVDTPNISTEEVNNAPKVSNADTVESESVAVSEAGGSDISESVVADTASEGDELVADEPVDTVLWENDGIKVIYKGIEKDYVGINIKVLVENNSSTNKTVSLESLDVNGYSINSALSLYATVNAGKKTNDSISIYNTYLQDNGINGIDDIENIEMTFRYLDTDTYDSVESNPVTLTF